MPAVRGVNEARASVRASSRLPFDVRAISRPARTFTGDFYVTHRHEDRLWIALGDVAGKGLPAAIVMAMIQEELEHRIASCASAECDPSRTAARLHEFLAPLLPSNRFATAVIAWIRDDGLLTLANAGHCPPLILRKDGTVEEIASTGPILGVLPNAVWRSTQTRLAPGETLVLYSDGVTEAEVDGEELGVQGLRALLARGVAPEDVLERLSTTDDVTLVAVRV
jgi:sigma-B regulation protein RsbU (phosphoserine phosphatase)